MNLVKDERRKHQLIGVVVIIAIATLFVPAFLKNKHNGLDKELSLTVHLPPKPSRPSVVQPNEKERFKSVKVAHVDLTQEVLTPISQFKKSRTNTHFANTNKMRNKQVALNSKNSNQTSVIAKKRIEKSHKKSLKKAQETRYVIQLASFAVEKNAIRLVKELHHKGYKAMYRQAPGAKGSYFKVLVGQTNTPDAAKKLQVKLADSLHMKGFIVRTKVS